MYRARLGLPAANFLDHELGWMEFGQEEGTHFAIGQWRGPGPLTAGPGGGVAVLAADDAYQVIAELRQRGVKCNDPVPIPGMVTCANCFDPDGNRLQIVGPPPKA